MRVFRFSVLFDGAVEGAGGGPAGGAAGGGAGTGTGVGTGGATSGTPASTGTPAGAAPAVTQPASTTTGATAAAVAKRKFEYEQEYGGRSNWIPPHRLSDVSAERDRLRAMLEAGTGVRVREENRVSPELEAARSEFFQLFPELRKVAEFFEKQGESLSSIIERAPELLSSNTQVWRRHGSAALTTIYSEMAKDLGVETIEPNSKQARMLGRNFVAWLEEDEANQEAYISQPPQQVAEMFLADMRSGFFDPIRRVAQAGSSTTAAGNARLPRTTTGGAPAGGGAGQKPLTEDEVHANAFKTMQQIVAGNRR